MQNISRDEFEKVINKAWLICSPKYGYSFPYKQKEKKNLTFLNKNNEQYVYFMEKRRNGKMVKVMDGQETILVGFF